MWVERNREHPNYARIDYVWQQHHQRYAAYVKQHGLICQACGGAGSDGSYSDAYHCEPPELCGWCETTGYVTRWLRGLWLRTMREEAAARRRKQQKKAQTA